MSTFDFNDKEDCQEFIALILDNYCPKQLEGIDALVLGDAVKSCKENGIELTGNNIFNECCVISVTNLIDRLDDIKKYEMEDLEKLTSYEFDCVMNFLNSKEQIETIINWCCNGSLDSFMLINESNITNENRVAIQKLNEITSCFTDLQDEIGYISGLDELLECEVKIEINEPDICD